MQSRRLDQQAEIKLTLLRVAAANHVSHDLAPSVFHMSQLCPCIFGCGIVSHVHIPVPFWWCHTCECDTPLPSVMGPELGNYNMMKKLQKKMYNFFFFAEAFFSVCIHTDTLQRGGTQLLASS